jgi:hypothetical protein
LACAGDVLRGGSAVACLYRNPIAVDVTLQGNRDCAGDGDRKETLFLAPDIDRAAHFGVCI